MAEAERILFSSDRWIEVWARLGHVVLTVETDAELERALREMGEDLAVQLGENLITVHTHFQDYANMALAAVNRLETVAEKAGL